MTYDKQISSLKKRLDNVEYKLKNLSIEISISKEISNSYWNRLKRQAKQYYEEARIIFADWSKLNIPKSYNDTLATQIRRIKNFKFNPPNPLNYRKTKNKDINKQTISTILEESLSSFYSGTQAGNNQLNRLMAATQQLNIKEKQVNQAIEKGFIEGGAGVIDFNKKVGRGSVYGVQRSLQNELMKKALNEQYITIVNKNGDPVNYNIKSYAELVARTKLIETQSSATVNLSMQYGSGLVQVSSHNTQTPYDATFEGKVFDLTGNNPRFPTASDLPPFHPNCQHTLTVFFEEALNEQQIQDISDFSKGKTEIHPTRKGHIPIRERKF